MTVPENFIVNRLKFWKKKIKVKQKVLWITDFDSWQKLVIAQNLKAKKNRLPFGAVSLPDSKQDPIIFISMTKNDTKKEMENTIIHELLHIKNPNLTELQIRKEVKKLI